MRRITYVLAALFVSINTANAQRASDRFSSHAREHAYIHTLIGPTALLGVGVATAYDELSDEPPEWDGSSGFWKRAASNAGRFVVQTSLHHGVAAVMDRSTWYYDCTCRGTGARIGHAFAEAITDHDISGHTHFSVARVAGAYGGAAAQSLWQPNMSGGEVLFSGTMALVGSGVVNLWREFVH